MQPNETLWWDFMFIERLGKYIPCHWFDWDMVAQFIHGGALSIELRHSQENVFWWVGIQVNWELINGWWVHNPEAVSLS